MAGRVAAKRDEQPARADAGLPLPRGARRIGRHHVLVPARHGLFLVNHNDLYVGRALLRYGEYGELEWRLLRQLCARGMRVVEVGANIGALSVPLARRLGPGGRLIAVEPQPTVFRNLCANLLLNELENVEPLPLGCADAPGQMAVPAVDYGRPGNFGGVSLRQPSVPGRRKLIEVRTLDAIVGEEHVHLVKIDVEGMEESVLRGAERLLERSRPVLYLENDRVERSPGLISWLLDRSYRLWWHLPPLFNPANQRGDDVDRYPRIVSVNMLAVHESRPVEMRGLREVTDPDEHPMRRLEPVG